MDTPLTRSLPVQPQAIMGSGLVDPRRDFGQTVLRDAEEQQDWMGTGSGPEELFGRPCFVRPVFKHQAVRRLKGGNDSCG